MSPAEERRQLVLAAQRREPFMSDEWFGSEPGARPALSPADKPAHRGLMFVAVSATLVAAALGVCWILASSDSVAQWIQGSPDRSATTELTSAPAKPVDIAMPNAVPTTVQPAVVPSAPPVLEEAPPKVAPATPAVAVTTPGPGEAPSVPVTPVKALPAAPPAVHHEPAGPTTLRVVETPEPEPTSSDSE